MRKPVKQVQARYILQKNYDNTQSAKDRDETESEEFQSLGQDTDELNLENGDGVYDLLTNGSQTNLVARLKRQSFSQLINDNP